MTTKHAAYSNIKILGKGYQSDDTIIVEMPGYIYDIHFRLNEDLHDEDAMDVLICKETRRNLGINERARRNHRCQELVALYSQQRHWQKEIDPVVETRNMQHHDIYHQEFLAFDKSIKGAYTPYQPI